MPSEFSNCSLGESLTHMNAAFWLPHLRARGTRSFQHLTYINLCERSSFSANSF